MRRGDFFIVFVVILILIQTILLIIYPIHDHRKSTSISIFSKDNVDSIPKLNSTLIPVLLPLLEVYRPYLPHQPLHIAQKLTPGIFANQKTTDFQYASKCAKEMPEWKYCDPPICNQTIENVYLNYPRNTFNGENTSDFIDRILRAAWGPTPPSIDLFLHSGCVGIFEMKHLFESVEIFWPRFLGAVILVLDVSDRTMVEKIIPSNSKHHYQVEFEHVPCMPPRLFSQYTYLTLDQYSTADYVATIDSDCAFFTPVTPDLIFRERGKILLPFSNWFQTNLWKASVELFGRSGFYRSGTTMVSQPVVFFRKSFQTYREWFAKEKGMCYEIFHAEFSRKQYFGPVYYFCWMCHFGAFLDIIQDPAYYIYQLSNPNEDVMLRYALHTTYEPVIEPDKHTYTKSTALVITQGLCRAFGKTIFLECTDNFNLVNHLTFTYANVNLINSDTQAKTNALIRYINRLSIARIESEKIKQIH